MRKLIAVFLALVLICTLIVPASAATTMRWDWNAARKSINNAATDLIREEHQSTEIPETEYVVVEETEATVSKTEMVEPVAETTVEREQSWRDWMRQWSWCLEGRK